MLPLSYVGVGYSQTTDSYVERLIRAQLVRGQLICADISTNSQITLIIFVLQIALLILNKLLYKIIFNRICLQFGVFLGRKLSPTPFFGVKHLINNLINTIIMQICNYN